MPRPTPRLALALLERFVPDSEPLAGDLIEEFERRQSVLWFWWQVLGAVAAAWFAGDAEIRPLRLVDLQPVEALERTRRWCLRFRPVNMSASPVAGVGGLGLVVLASLLTVDMPAAYGSPIYADHRPAWDASCVALTRNAGAHTSAPIAAELSAR